MKSLKNNRMEFYRGKLLIYLADAYRKSKKDSGTNVIYRRTSLKPEKLYRKYRQNDGDIAEIEALNEAVMTCYARGFVNFEQKKFSNEVDVVYLKDERIEEIESFLKQQCGYEPKEEKLETVRGIIRRYQGKSPAADEICEKLKEELTENRVPKQYDKTEDVLRALVFVENNRSPLYLREASMMIYGSSKYFEDNTLDSVCRKLRKYLKRPREEDELLSEILEEYLIYAEQPRFCIKGNIILKKAGKELEIGAFSGGIEFAADEIEEIEEIHVHAGQFVTVENKTAYLRCKDKNSVFFYLGGYANRSQRDFLKRIRRSNSQLKFLHFGDIDAGGFYIYDHLCRLTGISFGLWHMSIEELMEPKYQAYLQKLTENDRRRLQKLSQREYHKKIVEYMLQENVKLEQEIVSYEIFKEEKVSPLMNE